MVQVHDRPQSFRKFQFQDYRFVLKELVGRLPVQSFRTVRGLIQVFRDALHGTFSHPEFISLYVLRTRDLVVWQIPPGRRWLPQIH